MKEFDNTGKGAIWPNARWQPEGGMPKWTGRLYADRDIRAGEEIPLAMWPVERKSEKSPALRISIDRWKEKNKKPQKEVKVMEPIEPSPEDFNDDIPF